MSQEKAEKKNAWSYFLRFGIFMSVLGLAFQVLAVADPEWAHAPKRKSVTETGITTSQPAGVGLGQFGDVVSAEFGVFEFCLSYEVLGYGNTTVAVCWEYDDDLIIDGEQKYSCKFLDGINLCDHAQRTQVAVLVSLVLMALSDVFSEKSAVSSTLLILASIFSMVNVFFWTDFMKDFKRADGTQLTMEWGTGMDKFIFGTVCLIISTAMVTVAFYFWDFGEHDKCFCKCIAYLYEPYDPNIDHAPSALSQRQQFYKDGVGPFGRVGAATGLVVWTLCLAIVSDSDWITVSDRSISEKLEGFEQLDGGGKLGLGGTYLVLNKDVTTAGFELVQAQAYAKFGYDTAVALQLDNGTVIQQIPPLYDSFAERDIDFEGLQNVTVVLLIFAGVATFFGDVYSEYTAINGLLCFIGTGCCVAATVYSYELMSQINDLSSGFVKRGRGLDLILAAAGFGLIGFLSNMIDARMYGWFSNRYETNDSSV